MEAHAARTGTALAIELGHRVRVDAVAHADHGLAGAASGRDAARHRRAVELREQGLLLRQRVGFAGIRFGTEPAVLQQAGDARRDLAHDPGDLGIVRRGEGMKSRSPVGARLVDPVEQQRVEVQVQVERVSEALHEGDRAALTAGDVPLPASSASQRCEDGADEDAEYSTREPRVIGA